MAVTLKASGSWTEFTTGNPSVAIPGSPAAGDRLYVWVVWKNQSITASSSTMTEIAEYKDGTTASGNGTGSMTIACYYRDYVGGDGNQTVTMSGAVGVGAYVAQLWQKSAGEQWEVPVFASAAHASSAGSVTRSASAAVSVMSGSVVMCAWGIADDTATFTRPTTAIDVASGITWNGNYVEDPATHHSSTTGNDMAADLGHRFVTTGAAGATLRSTVTALSAAETGAILWVVQPVTTTVTQTAPPNAFVWDTFTDTNGVNVVSSHTGEVGATWVTHPGWAGQATISNNRAYISSEAAVLASTTPPSANYEVTCAVTTLTRHAGVGICVIGRADVNGQYWINYEEDATWAYLNLRRWYFPSFSYTELSPYLTVAVPPLGETHTVTLRMQGTSISVLYDGTLLGGPYTSSDITVVGKAGIGGSPRTANTGTHVAYFSANPYPNTTDFVKDYTDLVGITDSLAKDAGRGATDAVGVTDSATFSLGFAVPATDLVGVTDSLAKEAGKTATDLVGVTDSISVQQDWAQSQTDAVGVTDSFTAQQDWVRSTTDLVGVTDSATFTVETLLGEWGFLNNLDDTSGNGRHGTFTAGSGGSLTYVSGPTVDTLGIQFSHADDFVDLGRTGLEPTVPGVTTMGWVYLTATSTALILGVLSKARVSTSSRHRLAIQRSNGQGSYLARWKDDLQNNNVTGNLTAGWHHLALVDGNSRWQFYVDGVSKASGTRAFDTTPFTWEAHNWRIGRNSTITDVYADPTMSVSGIRIFKGELSTAGINAWMNTPIELVGTPHTAGATDPVGVTDAASVTQDFVRAQTDAVGVTDSATFALGFSAPATDPVGVTDSGTVQQGWARTQNDPVGVTDALAIDAGRTVTDSVGITDTAAATQDWTRAPTDLVGITDSASIGSGRTATDTVGATDSFSVVQAWVRSVTDSVGVTDSGSFDSAAAGDVADTDQVGITDTLGTISGNVRSDDDEVGVLDSALFAVGSVAGATDTVGITDLLAVIAAYERSWTDPVGVADDATFDLSSAGDIVESDLVGITDSADIAAGYARSLTDPVGVVDDAEFQLDGAAAEVVDATDSVGVVDAAFFAMRIPPGPDNSWVPRAESVIHTVVVSANSQAAPSEFTRFAPRAESNTYAVRAESTHVEVAG